MLCTTMLQPFSKKGLEPTDVFRFKWEENEDDSENLSAKEIWKRFEEVKREQGLE